MHNYLNYSLLILLAILCEIAPPQSWPNADGDHTKRQYNISNFN